MSSTGRGPALCYVLWLGYFGGVACLSNFRHCMGCSLEVHCGRTCSGGASSQPALGYSSRTRYIGNLKHVCAIWLWGVLSTCGECMEHFCRRRSTAHDDVARIGPLEPVAIYARSLARCGHSVEAMLARNPRNRWGVRLQRACSVRCFAWCTTLPLQPRHTSTIERGEPFEASYIRYHPHHRTMPCCRPRGSRMS